MTAARPKLAYLIGGRIQQPDPSRQARNPRPEFAEFCARNNAVIVDFGILDSPRFPERLLRVPRPVLFGLRSKSHRRRYDAAVASGEDIGMWCALSDLLALRRRPLCIITHGSFFASGRWERAARLMRYQDHVHWACLSQRLADVMVEKFHFPRNRVHNAGYGVDLDFFRPSDTPVDRRLIVAAGTASRDYNILVEACKGLDAKLRIAADSAWFPSKVNISEHDLPPGVHVASAGDYHGLRDLYAAASFVVVPLKPVVHAAGYAVIAEAMAMGKPVISTRTPSVSDFIDDGVNGFLVEPGDVEGLRKRLRQLLADPDLARSMGEHARRDSEQLWSLQSYCERLEQIVAVGLNRGALR